MAESIHEQIAASLQVSLAAIVSDDGLSPRVGRVVFFEDHDLDTSLDYIILMRPGDEHHVEESTQEIRGEMEVFLFLARKFTPATEIVWSVDAPSRWTVADRMVQDVLKAIFNNVTLSGLVNNLVNDSFMVDRARFMDKWACAEVRFVVNYSWQKGAP